MPIEFACESCARLLRVPDGSQGNQCECPACKSILKIPDPSTVGMVEVHNASDDLKLDLQIPCPKCQKPLRCSPDLIGTKGQCRSCQYIFLITDNPESDSVGSTSLVFSCPKCQQLFEGQEEMRGRKGKCHVCGEVFAIELKAADAAPGEPSPSDDSDVSKDHASAGQDTQPVGRAKPQPANIQFSCSSCNGVMEVPASTVGQRTACPYCSKHLIIPAPSAASRPETPHNRSRAPAFSEQYSPPTSNHSEVEAEDRLAALDLPEVSQPLNDPYATGTLTQAAQPEFSDINPYHAPMSDYSVSTGDWNAKRQTRQKELTFSNVFSLTFERAFPNSLLASLVYIVGFGLAGGIFYGGMAVVILILKLIGMQSPVFNGTILVVVGLVLFGVSLFVGNYAFCMLYRSALLTIRGKKHSLNDLFAVGDSSSRMLLYLFLVTLISVFAGLLPQLLQYALGPENSIIALFVGSLIGLVCALFSLAISLAPFGIVDGLSTGEAIEKSLRIFKNHALTFLLCVIVTILIWSAAALVTCGIGIVLLIGFPLCVLGAVYDLAPKPR